MKTIFNNFPDILEMVWAKIIVFFGYKYDKSKIPFGTHYCYLPDDEKNEQAKSFSNYYKKPCPYFKYISTYYRGCKYLGIITDDPVFSDQCKMCGENYEDDENYL